MSAIGTVIGVAWQNHNSINSTAITYNTVLRNTVARSSKYNKCVYISTLRENKMSCTQIFIYRALKDCCAACSRSRVYITALLVNDILNFWPNQTCLQLVLQQDVVALL
jgi:hypothetical protein